MLGNVPPTPTIQKNDRGKWIASWIIMYLIGALSVGLGLLMVSRNPSSIIVPAITLAVGCTFLLLATLVAVRKSQTAIIAGIVIYALDLVLNLIALNLFAVLIHAAILTVLILGVGATKRLALQDKVPTVQAMPPDTPLQM